MPIGSGAYTIARMPTRAGASSSSATRTTGRATCRVRRGFYNFDSIVYRYYADEDDPDRGVQGRRDRHRSRVLGADLGAPAARARSSTTAGSSRRRPRRHRPGPAGLELNLRRPIFQDIRVREALELTFDFETNNRTETSACKRATACSATRSSRPRACRRRASWRSSSRSATQLPEEVFGPPYVRPRTDSDPHGAARQPVQARALLAQAGWRPGADGVLRNAKGEPFSRRTAATTTPTSPRASSPGCSTAPSSASTTTLRQVDFALFSKPPRGIRLRHGDHLEPSSSCRRRAD